MEQSLMQISQYDLCIVDLNPTRGSEMTKIRPCIVISPNEANKYLNTIIIAPVTSKVHHFKFRGPVNTATVYGEIALDHLRSIDKARVTKIVGVLDKTTIEVLKCTLKEFLID